MRFRRSTAHITLALAICAAFYPTARALEFRFLGEYPVGQSSSLPYSVTNDGKTIVGEAYGASGFTTFAWTESQGIGSPSSLGLPDGTVRVSPDGGVFAGVDMHLGFKEQFIWTAASGTQWLGRKAGVSDTYVYGISQDGASVVGIEAANGWQPTMWSADTGLIRLNTGPHASGVALAVNDDGTVIVGGLEGAVRWTSPTTFERLPGLPDTQDYGWASDVSADGKRVVGYMHAEHRNQAFLWEEGQGTRSLFTGQDGSSWGFARAISGDGQLVGGKMDEGANFANAFIWTEATGIQRLHDLVLSAGYDLGDWHLEEVFDISRNGRFVTGVARGSGFQAFLIDLYPSVAGDTDGNGVVDLDDLNNVRNNFGGSGLGDTDGDNDVDLDDLNAVRNTFGAGSPNPIPEPSSFALLALSVVGIVARRLNRRHKTHRPSTKCN